MDDNLPARTSRLRLPLAHIVALLSVLIGCHSSAGPKPQSVTALVAASTRDAVKELADRFTGETGIEVRLAADDTGKLAQQIANGAPAQVFLSANEKWAKYLDDKGLTAEKVSLLGNSLVIVVPAGSATKTLKPEDLLGADIKRIALAGPTVPAGMYARQALGKLKLLEPLEKAQKIVSGENVRVTLAYAERGEVEAAVVYSTDALISSKVRAVFTFPAELHEPIVYPLVLLKPAADVAGGSSDGGRRFYDYLKSSAAGETFRHYGFQVPAAQPK